MNSAKLSGNFKNLNVTIEGGVYSFCNIFDFSVFNQNG